MIVIVAHESAEDLSRCLPSIFACQGDVELRVVVADSGSSDDPAGAVAAYPVHFLPGENRGFAAACNRALAEPKAASARYVLFLNPDTELISGRLDLLLRRCDSLTEVGAFSVRQVDEQGKTIPSLHRFPSVGRYWAEALPIPRLRRLGHDLPPSVYEREADFDWATGSFLLVRGETLREVGGFDERFFFTSEEIDLCRRIQAAGWSRRYLCSVTIMHRWAGRSIDPWREWMLIDGKLRYARKWCSRAGAVLIRVALLLRYAREACSPRGPDWKRTLGRLRLRRVLGLPAPAGPRG